MPADLRLPEAATGGDDTVASPTLDDAKLPVTVTRDRIHDLIRGLARDGMGVLLITDEIPEALANCNRVLLMRSGRLRGEVATAGLQPEELQRRIEARA